MFRRTARPLIAPPLILSHGGFVLGQVVRHKIDGVRVVITEFYPRDGVIMAAGSYSSKAGDTADFSVYELEAVEHAEALAAVDPVEGSGEGRPRAPKDAIDG
jgi:hypothetical protein